MADSPGRCVVVSQPMYFPWVGMLEQIRLADHFVYYDDVQFARGFFNRVQIKTHTGIRWLTVPLAGMKRGQLINQVRIDYSADWMRSHLDQLKQAYDGAPCRADMLALVEQVLASRYETLADLAQASMDALVRYYPSLAANKPFTTSSRLGVTGASTQRLVDICASVQADHYLTGHGARHYLDHLAFESRGIAVSYMRYGTPPYPQLHGAFTPYVSALDLIANLGADGLAQIGGQPVPWREFLTTTAASAT
ncbi:WbqC family protein [Achromobacter ruhlandii]|uniref:WbqC family protein n=1 Tax=Achromobacter ruhlandii TaxID=72557 RepID=A0A2M9GXL9_9BURK|nr:WbqC family protein [Achromobacter ruhlandii]PJM69324.1 hypothetical protein CV751_16010 [Achromobacter ruhlandii]CAB3883612.1 hypothetical protein LMG3328_03419 [Achromobacter ruhlandii]